MGLFDSIFSPNTTASTDAATQGALAGLNMTEGANEDILRNAAGKATDYINRGAQQASGDIRQGYSAGINSLQNYGNRAQGALASGVSNAVGTVLGGNAAYQPYATTGGHASGMLDNALGLNGASGNAAAVGAFQAAPGYQYQVDQATDAAARKAASLGVAASGNTLDAITRLGSNLANQGYQTWLQNLQNASGQGLQAAQGMSNNNQAAGGYQYGGGATGAQLFQNTGTQIGNARIGRGTALGNIATGQGANLANIQTGLGSSLVANNTGLGEFMANLGMQDANAQDSAASQNNGILDKALGAVGGSFLSPIGTKVGGQIANYL